MDVQTTGYVGSYSIASGTSVAAAHVSAVAAVLKGMDQTKSNNFIIQLMQASANKVNFTDRNSEYGYGAISLENAIDMYDTFNPQNTNSSEEITNNMNTYEITDDFSEENGYVEGSWSSNTWNSLTAATGTGHKSMINMMSSSYFTSPSSSDTTTEKENIEVSSHRLHTIQMLLLK